MSSLHCSLEHLLSVIQITQTNQATDMTYLKKANVSFRWLKMNYPSLCEYAWLHLSIFFSCVRVADFLAFTVKLILLPNRLLHWFVALYMCLFELCSFLISFPLTSHRQFELMSRSLGHDCRICRRLSPDAYFPLFSLFLFEIAVASKLVLFYPCSSSSSFLVFSGLWASRCWCS